MSHDHSLLQRGVQVEEICSDTDHPLIVRVIDSDEVDASYIIVIEKNPLLVCSAILSAIFTLFAVHYVFDIEYHEKAKDFYLFLEDKIFNVKSGTILHSANYANIVTSIEGYLD